jgi:hypothetical protein
MLTVYKPLHRETSFHVSALFQCKYLSVLEGWGKDYIQDFGDETSFKNGHLEDQEEDGYH